MDKKLPLGEQEEVKETKAVWWMVATEGEHEENIDNIRGPFIINFNPWHLHCYLHLGLCSSSTVPWAVLSQEAVFSLVNTQCPTPPSTTPFLSAVIIIIISLITTSLLIKTWLRTFVHYPVELSRRRKEEITEKERRDAYLGIYYLFIFDHLRMLLFKGLFHHLKMDIHLIYLN